jgi:hypothetical protein
VPCTIWPASHPEADDQYDQGAFTRYGHIGFIQLHQQADKFAPARETQNQSPTIGAAEGEYSRLQGGGSPPSWPVKPQAHVKSVQNCSLHRSLRIGSPHPRHSHVNEMHSITP